MKVTMKSTSWSGPLDLLGGLNDVVALKGREGSFCLLSADCLRWSGEQWSGSSHEALTRAALVARVV
jgi:hypothetical protein